MQLLDALKTLFSIDTEITSSLPLATLLPETTIISGHTEKKLDNNSVVCAEIVNRKRLYLLSGRDVFLFRQIRKRENNEQLAKRFGLKSDFVRAKLYLFFIKRYVFLFDAKSGREIKIDAEIVFNICRIIKQNKDFFMHDLLAYLYSKQTLLFLMIADRDYLELFTKLMRDLLAGRVKRVEKLFSIFFKIGITEQEYNIISNILVTSMEKILGFYSVDRERYMDTWIDTITSIQQVLILTYERERQDAKSKRSSDFKTKD